MKCSCSQFLSVLGFVNLLCLASSCHHQSPWSTSQINSHDPHFSSLQVAFYAEDPVHGLDVEFLKTFQNLYLYLSTHAPFKHSWVDITIDGQKLRFQGHPQKGYQRLLLPKDATELILSALARQSPIDIAIAGFNTRIPPGHFPL